jgi:uncharacterized protein (TIGR02145 family)
MKKIFTIVFVLFLIGNTLNAQDTMYVHQTGGVLKIAVNKIDSIIFYATGNGVTDIDGNVYNTVTIGTQTWMTGNLKTTKYNDGVSIPLISDNLAWDERTTGAYCWYNNDPTANENLYGKLYNWYTVNTGKLCPTGWHVPTDAEWVTLKNYLTNNGYGFEGSGSDIAKSMSAKTAWATSPYVGSPGNDPSSNNSSGFSALPGGYRSGPGSFNGIGEDGYWWSASEYNSTDALYRYLQNSGTVIFGDNRIKVIGYSVRCMKD